MSCFLQLCIPFPFQCIKLLLQLLGFLVWLFNIIFKEPNSFCIAWRSKLFLFLIDELNLVLLFFNKNLSLLKLMLSTKELLFKITYSSFILHSFSIKSSNGLFILLFNFLYLASEICDLALKLIYDSFTLINIILMSNIFLIFICYSLSQIVQIIFKLIPIVFCFSQEVLKQPCYLLIFCFQFINHSLWPLLVLFPNLNISL